MADSLIHVMIGLHEQPATVAGRLLRTAENAQSRNALTRVCNELAALGTARDGKLVVRVDSVTRGAAAQTVVVESDDTTAGDKLHIAVPGWPSVALTAVATAGEVTTTGGQWSLEVATDTAKAVSLRNAINNHPLLKQHLVATESSGTVTITAREPGEWAHGITLRKEVTTAGALTLGGATLVGGDDVLDQPQATITCGTPDIVADDTITIGGTVLTWKASASTESEVTLSTTPATAATNLTAKINAHSKLQGLIIATRDSAVITLSWVGDPRAGSLVTLARTETNSGSVVLSAAVLAAGTTLAYQDSARSHGGMGAA